MANPTPSPPAKGDFEWLKKLPEHPRAPWVVAAVFFLFDVVLIMAKIRYESLPVMMVIGGVVGTILIGIVLFVLRGISTKTKKEMSVPATILLYAGLFAGIAFIVAFCWHLNSYASSYTNLEKAKLQHEVDKIKRDTELLKVTPAAADWGEDSIPDRASLAHESDFLEVTSPNPANDKDESLAWEVSMDKWKDWLRIGCKAEEEGGKLARQTLVVEADYDSGFPKDYNDIHGKIELGHGIELKWGACFLVKEIELPNKVKAPILRQQPFLVEVNDSGKFHSNQFQLLSPRKGEKLIFILRVQKLEGMVGALPSAATQYGVNIKTSGKRAQQ